MSDFKEIEEMMWDYFRILNTGDVAGIEAMFLPQCNLVCAQEDGSATVMMLGQYKDAVGKRTAPKDEGYPVYGRTVSIDQSGPQTAVVKVDCAVQPRYFTDYLTLVKEKGRWRIAAKVYYVTAVRD